MKLRNHLSKILTTGAALSMLIAGCAVEEDEVAEIGNLLELEDGGYDMEDEAPMFGVDETFAQVGLTDLEADYSDPMESDAEVVAMNNDPDSVAYKATVLWGMMPPDSSVTTPRRWDGALSVNRGAILARRSIRFEGPTDEILPRDNRRVLKFRSSTLPHVDGLRLLLIDPTPSAGPFTLTYTSTDGASAHTVNVRDLLDGPQSRSVGSEGNRIAAAAEARMVDVCQHGFLRGRWHKVADGRGRFIGRVADADGDLNGHVRGIYGERLDGAKVFFGKYIDTEGRFKGLFGGTYDAGQFRGAWKSRAGEIGALGGEYRESLPGPETGGHFLGTWRELSCTLPVPLR